MWFCFVVVILFVVFRFHSCCLCVKFVFFVICGCLLGYCICVIVSWRCYVLWFCVFCVRLSDILLRFPFT
jgi:hypothetical protein